MADTYPQTFHKDGKTRTCVSPQHEVMLRWAGWLPDGQQSAQSADRLPPPPPQQAAEGGEPSADPGATPAPAPAAGAAPAEPAADPAPADGTGSSRRKSRTT